MSESLGRHIVLGMAGHIDHGKTEIVKALTGTDTDRLKEEKERGMTTDLGFAAPGKFHILPAVPGGNGISDIFWFRSGHFQSGFQALPGRSGKISARLPHTPAD